MSKYKTDDYIKFDTPEQYKQVVEKLESEGYKVDLVADDGCYRGVRYNDYRGMWLYAKNRLYVATRYGNDITDKFWDEYEAEQDLTICLEGAYCPRYYKVDFTVEDSIEFFIDNLNFSLPDSSIRTVNGVVTLVIDVKTKSTHIPSFLESAMASILCIEISTESGTNLPDELLHISGSTGGLVAKAKDVDNYNKWLDAVKFNRSQEFKILTEGFEESLEIIDSLYK